MCERRRGRRRRAREGACREGTTTLQPWILRLIRNADFALQAHVECRAFEPERVVRSDLLRWQSSGNEVRRPKLKTITGELTTGSCGTLEVNASLRLTEVGTALRASYHGCRSCWRLCSCWRSCRWGSCPYCREGEKKEWVWSETGQERALVCALLSWFCSCVL